MAKGTERAPGQQKVHTITNPATGETREVTQAEWREQGAALRAQGFERPEDVEDEPEEEEPGEII